MSHIEPRQFSGQKRQPPGYRFDTGDYEQFQCIYIYKGELVFHCNYREDILTPGMVVLLRIGSAFTLSCPEQGYEGVYFIDTNTALSSYRGRSCAFFAHPDIHELGRLMRIEFDAPGPGTREVLLGLGQALAWMALRQDRQAQLEESRPAYDEYFAASARHALDATLRTGRSARDVLSAIPLSYRQLSRYFHDIYGMTPKQYQIVARLQEAQRLLDSTTLPVTAIAFELGYSSSQHFATQFQRQLGLSPSAYRRQQSETS